MSLVLLVLLEDNIWTEGMSGADVTCSIGTLGGQHLDRKDEWCRCHLFYWYSWRTTFGQKG